MKKLSLMILTVLLSTILTLAQGTTGTIVGTVTAPDGVVPGATIVVRDAQTGREQTVTASSDGTFTVPQLTFGTYTVTITAAGYKTFVANEVKIDAGREYPLNALLEVGQITEQVTVTAGAEQINASNAELSNTISQQQIRELPINGRNPLSLINLQAGTSPTSSSINGQRTSSVNYTRDGLNVQDNFIRNGFVSDQPTVDDTGEITITTQNAGAELGSGSTQIQLVTPRGGQEYHGNLYAFNRNSYFASNNFFSKINGLERPFLNRNQYGGSISGPVPFFNFGEGGPTFFKDKAFFFFNYEGFRLAQQVSIVNLQTLLPAARTGNFTYTAGGTEYTINVLTGQNLVTSGTNAAGADRATLFSNAGGVLPISQTIQNRILNQLPTSGNGLTTGTNFLQVVNLNRSNPEERNGYTGRFDLDITSRNSVNLVYKRSDIIDARTDVAAGFSPDVFVNQGGPTDFFVAAWRWTPTNSFSNEIRGGFQNSYPFFNGIGNLPTDYLLSLPLVTNPENTFFDQGRNTYYRNIQDNAVYSTGNHSLRFGGQIQTYTIEALNYAGVTPTFSISGTGNTATPSLDASLFPGAISATDLARANSLRYLLAGIIGGGSQTFNLVDTATGFQAGAPALRPLNFEIYSAYVSDQWRIAPNFTLNLGLRYELYTPLNDPRGLYLEPVLSNLDDPLASVLNPNGTYNYVGTSIGKVGDFFRPDKDNFGPNISFAWSPKFETGFFSKLIGNSTVLRGGFRVNYNNDEYVRAPDNALLGNVGLGAVNSIATRANGSASLRSTLDPVAGFEPLPGFTTPVFNAPPRSYVANNSTRTNGTVFAIDPNLQIQRSYEYNFGIQRDIGFNSVLEVRYVGNMSNELLRTIDYNQVEIRDNGFLADFINAQNNCRLQGATLPNPTNDQRDPLWRCTDARYNPAIAGSVPLPVFNQLASGGLLNNTTIIGFLRNGTVGELPSTYLFNNLQGNVQFLANPSTYVANLLTNGGKQRYNALQAEVRRRFSNGFGFQANYTFQKTLADVVDDSQTRVNPYIDNENQGLDYGRPDYDRTHTVNANFIYELPFGKGKRFVNGGGFTNLLFGGFQFTSIVNIASGAPIGILDPRGTLNRTGRSGRQSAFSSLSAKELSKLIGEFKTPNGVFYFNPANLYALGSNGQRLDLTQPLPTGVTISSIRAANPIDQAPFDGQVLFYNQAGQSGNLPRNFLNGPMYFNIDMGLSKNVRLTENTRLQLRWEVFNVLNHANFSIGDLDINSTQFSRITSTFAPRVMQFGARFDF